MQSSKCVFALSLFLFSPGFARLSMCKLNSYCNSAHNLEKSQKGFCNSTLLILTTERGCVNVQTVMFSYLEDPIVDTETGKREITVDLFINTSQKCANEGFPWAKTLSKAEFLLSQTKT